MSIALKNFSRRKPRRKIMNDLVERKAILEMLNNSYVHEDGIHYWRDHNNDCIDELIKKFNAIPSADIPQGEWLPFEFGDECWHKCSCCGTADKYIEYVPRSNGTVGKLVAIRNFCPNCGAGMRGVDDE